MKVLVGVLAICQLVSINAMAEYSPFGIHEPLGRESSFGERNMRHYQAMREERERMQSRVVMRIEGETYLVYPDHYKQRTVKRFSGFEEKIKKELSSGSCVVEDSTVESGMRMSHFNEEEGQTCVYFSDGVGFFGGTAYSYKVTVERGAGSREGEFTVTSVDLKNHIQDNSQAALVKTGHAIVSGVEAVGRAGAQAVNSTVNAISSIELHSVPADPDRPRGFAPWYTRHDTAESNGSTNCND